MPREDTENLFFEEGDENHPSIEGGFCLKIRDGISRMIVNVLPNDRAVNREYRKIKAQLKENDLIPKLDYMGDDKEMDDKAENNVTDGPRLPKKRNLPNLKPLHLSFYKKILEGIDSVKGSFTDPNMQNPAINLHRAFIAKVLFQMAETKCGEEVIDALFEKGHITTDEANFLNEHYRRFLQGSEIRSDVMNYFVENEEILFEMFSAIESLDLSKISNPAKLEELLSIYQKMRQLSSQDNQKLVNTMNDYLSQRRLYETKSAISDLKNNPEAKAKLLEIFWEEFYEKYSQKCAEEWNQLKTPLVNRYMQSATAIFKARLLGLQGKEWDDFFDKEAIVEELHALNQRYSEILDEENVRRIFEMELGKWSDEDLFTRFGMSLFEKEYPQLRKAFSALFVSQALRVKNDEMTKLLLTEFFEERKSGHKNDIECLDGVAVYVSGRSNLKYILDKIEKKTGRPLQESKILSLGKGFWKIVLDKGGYNTVAVTKKGDVKPNRIVLFRKSNDETGPGLVKWEQELLPKKDAILQIRALNGFELWRNPRNEMAVWGSLDETFSEIDPPGQYRFDSFFE